MKSGDKILIAVSVPLVLLQAGLLYLLFFRDASGVGTLPTHQAYIFDKSFYEPDEGSQPAAETAPADRIYGGIVPHHLIASKQIGQFFSQLPAEAYDRVVLLAPNHKNRGGQIIVSDQAWQTPFGVLEPDEAMMNKLAIAIMPEPFGDEPAVSGLVGFIKARFTGVKFIPILLEGSVTAEQAARVASVLAETLPAEKTLVLSTIDFSHYLPLNVADFHDEASRQAIENFSFERLYDLEIDSRPALYVLLKYLELIGAEKSELVDSSNSGRINPDSSESTTGHNYYLFKQGQAPSEPFLSGLFFGDLMLDRHVGEKIKKNSLDYLLEPLAGSEGRFFQGIDLIGANLEGAVIDKGEHRPPVMAYDFAFSPETIAGLKKYSFNFFNLANNHITDQGQVGYDQTKKHLAVLGLAHSGCPDQVVGDCSGELIKIGSSSVGLVGLSEVYGSLDVTSAARKVSELKKEASFVIVNIHWGREYEHQFSARQQELARALVDAGADIIIGHHPHVVQGMEIYRGHPIFYSLGNFIFDQYFSADTQEGLGAGFVFADGHLQIFLLPIKSSASRLRLMNVSERSIFFKKFIVWSELTPSEQERLATGGLTLQ
jgi:poly-gamma-glutamate synthesis protein (capsule biosynthesis protein)